MKFLKILILTIFIFILGGVLFIKFNTSAAAEFTDNVLRPTLGDSFVIDLERLYFNFTDSD